MVMVSHRRRHIHAPRRFVTRREAAVRKRPEDRKQQRERERRYPDSDSHIPNRDISQTRRRWLNRTV
jgi:hypothetical protein